MKGPCATTTLPIMAPSDVFSSERSLSVRSRWNQQAGYGKTPPQVGPRRGFNGRFAKEGCSRTERRDQDDTPKEKMVFARLPDIVEARNHMMCCACATVRISQFVFLMRVPAMDRALVSERGR